MSRELNDDMVVEGALFDETAAAYARLRTKTENVMADLLGQAVRDSLKAYVRGCVKILDFRLLFTTIRCIYMANGGNI